MSKERINVPGDYKDSLPFIWWALMRLRDRPSELIDWVRVPGRVVEGMAQPLLSSFTKETKSLLEHLCRLHSKSRSCIVATALALYQQPPNLPDRPRGLISNEKEE